MHPPGIETNVIDVPGVVTAQYWLFARHALQGEDLLEQPSGCTHPAIRNFFQIICHSWAESLDGLGAARAELVNNLEIN